MSIRNLFLNRTKDINSEGTLRLRTFNEWANRLYDEQAFTPYLTQNASTTPVGTNDGAWGQSIKLGNVLFFTILYVLINKGGATGDVVIRGIPVTDHPNLSYVVQTEVTGVPATVEKTYGIVQSGSAPVINNSYAPYITVRHSEGTNLTFNDITPTSIIRATGFYILSQGQSDFV